MGDKSYAVTKMHKPNSTICSFRAPAFMENVDFDKGIFCVDNELSYPVSNLLNFHTIASQSHNYSMLPPAANNSRLTSMIDLHNGVYVLYKITG